MAGLALMFGGPKKGAEEKKEPMGDSEPMESGKSAAAKAVADALGMPDKAGELEKALTAFVSACKDSGEEY
jgi:hypothetical protein